MSRVKAYMPGVGTLDIDDDGTVRAIDTAASSSDYIAVPGLVDLAVRPTSGACLSDWLARESGYGIAGGISHALLDGLALAHSKQIADAGFDSDGQLRPWRVIPALTVDHQWQALANVARLAEMGLRLFDAGDHVPVELDRLQRSLQLCAQYGVTVAIRPRMAALNGDALVHRGSISERYGLDSQPSLAETAALALLLELAADTGARMHFKRLSSARSVAMLADAQARGLAVSADVSIAQLCFCEVDLADLDPRFISDPPLRTSADRDALRQAVADGVISAVVSDHRSTARSDALIEGLPGGQRAMHLLAPLMLHLAEQGVFDQATAMQRVSAGPADIAGIALPQASPGEQFSGAVFQAGSEKPLETAAESAWRGWPLRYRLKTA